MPSDAVPPQSQLSDFPAPHFPTVFADGVSTLVNSPSVVKFFLARFDPSFAGDGRSQLQAIAQVVMPLDGFATMFVFFETQLRHLVQGGFISEARLAEIRAALAGQPNP